MKLSKKRKLVLLMILFSDAHWSLRKKWVSPTCLVKTTTLEGLFHLLIVLRPENTQKLPQNGIAPQRDPIILKDPGKFIDGSPDPYNPIIMPSIFCVQQLDSR